MFQQLLSLLIVSSLGIGVVRRYLALNKLWVRRRERAVAESISIVALLLAMATSAPFLAKNVLRGDTKGTANELIWVFNNVFMILLGIGLWVPGKRQRLRERFAAALRLEGREASGLLRGAQRPHGAELIVKILRQVASLDDHLEERERVYIDRFASAWGLELGGAPGEVERGLPALRQSVADYLATAPPPVQVKQLRGVIDALVKIDQQVSSDEELARAELFGLLDHHLSGEAGARYHVAVVPQSPEQAASLIDLFPRAQRTTHSGGDVFVVTTHYAESYAEKMCDKYRSLGLLTLVLADRDTPAQGGR
ncbi:MAG: hypothetical protein MUF64_21800 [Polyangiaceae bacterium]|jgi:hypothetical protein|nr:hypothetical protein [Polyangiaceae bacterium]